MTKWFVLLIGFLVGFNLHADPSPAKEVFKLNVKQIDPNAFVLEWKIKADYFLYSDRIQLNTVSDSNVTLGPIKLPITTSKTDKLGHVYAIYRNDLSIPINVLGDKPGETLLNFSYQGCADSGFCYPPEKRQIKITIDNKLAVSQVSLEAPNSSPIANQNPINHMAQLFATHNWAMILLTFFGFGLLLSFTPCILPMVPVLSGIIVGQGKDLTTRKAFLLSLTYVLSMSVTYALAGAVVALAGANLQSSLQSTWAIGSFSLIFVLLAFSMFGFYELKLPDAWQAKIMGSSRNQQGGHYLGTMMMGSLSTLILSPCVTAPLIGVLTYISQTNNVLLGSLTLFVLSLGMGTPLLVIGSSAGRWLPATGAWMNVVKAFFGVLLIAVAIYLMARILPAPLSMTLWGCLFIFSGIYTYSVSGRAKLGRGIAVLLLVYGLLVLIGAGRGATNPLHPLTQIQTDEKSATNQNIQSQQSLTSVLQSINNAAGKPVMIDFYAEWCVSCKVIETTTLKDPKIDAALRRFAIIKIDVTANNAQDKEILRHFKVIAPPTFLFFNAKGEPLPQLNLIGENSVTTFLNTLKQADSDG